MVNPQLEDGYIKIANNIWKQFGKYRLSGEEWMVLSCILAKTYGYNKKEDLISISQFYTWTGMKKPSIIRAIKKLISKNIVSKKANKDITSYCFNKLYDTWKPLAKKLIVSNFANAVSKKANKPLAKKLHTKDNNKDNITKDNIYSSLESFSKEVVKVFNDTLKRNFHTFPPHSDKNLTYWLTIYTRGEVLQAIRNCIYHSFWKDKMTPTILFRKKNPQGEPVDYISQLLEVKPPHVQTSEEYWLEAVNEKRSEYGEPPLKSLYD